MLIKRKAAYTLVEVLTVLAIVSVLAGLVFVVASTSIRNGKSAACVTHLQQIWPQLSFTVKTTTGMSLPMSLDP